MKKNQNWFSPNFYFRFEISAACRICTDPALGCRPRAEVSVFSGTGPKLKWATLVTKKGVTPTLHIRRLEIHKQEKTWKTQRLQPTVEHRTKSNFKGKFWAFERGFSGQNQRFSISKQLIKPKLGCDSLSKTSTFWPNISKSNFLTSEFHFLTFFPTQ